MFELLVGLLVGYFIAKKQFDNRSNLNGHKKVNK